MEFEPQDQDVVGLLTKLKNAEGQYPEHMFVARRQMYLKRMAEIGMGIPADAGIQTSPKNPTPPTISPATSTLLESALIAAILIEASAVAYFYRDQLSDFFETITTEPRVQEVSPLPIVATSVEIQGVTPSPAVTATAPSATLAPSASPTGIPVTVPSTPVPGLAEENNDVITGTGNTTTTTGETSPNNVGPSQLDSTPVPNVNDNDDQGNHYGQTPKPERTIESNSNSDNNAPPQDSDTNDNNSGSNNNSGGGGQGTSPSDNPKPPKTK